MSGYYKLSLTQEEQGRIRDLFDGLWRRWLERNVAPGTRYDFKYNDAPDWLRSMGAATIDLCVDGNWKIASAWMNKDGSIAVWRKPFMRYAVDEVWLHEHSRPR